MLNFKPRLLHAAMLLALPTLLAGYPHEDAFAQTADVSATGNGLMNRPILKWVKKRFKKPAAAPLAVTEPTIWLAQTHIQLLNHPEPRKEVPYTGNFDPGLKFAEDKLNKYLGTTGEKMLKLVGGRDALLKIDIKPQVNFANPEVKATLYNKDGAFLWDDVMEKPNPEPTSFEHSPGKVEHVLDRSFRLMLPGEHLATGTKLRISVQDPNPAKRSAWVEDFELNVGAPTVFPVTMVDFQFFGGDGRTLPPPVVSELGRKLPIKELKLERFTARFDEAVILPRHGAPHIRATSFEDWKNKAQGDSTTELRAENERGVDLSQAILTAMVHAGAQSYISAFHGNFNDGTKFSFNGRGGDGMISSSTNVAAGSGIGVFAHEFSHNLNLWHWQERNNKEETYANKQYPYDGAMFGILPNESKFNPNNKTHNGPTWHYSSPTADKPFGEAIAPFIVANDGNKVYRRVISTSGSFEDKPASQAFGVFSDFDNRVSQDRLEKVLRVCNREKSGCFTWNQATGSYDKQVEGTPGVNLPRQAAPESVLSLVFATSVVNKNANLAYRPIGPYNSGIRNLYNPQNSAQRTQAKERAYCPKATDTSDGGCDYSVKVVQGGVTSVYMLPIDDESNNMLSNVALTDDSAVKHVAINVPSSGGAVTEMTIYKTPNVQLTSGGFSIDSAEQLFTRTF